MIESCSSSTGHTGNSASRRAVRRRSVEEKARDVGGFWRDSGVQGVGGEKSPLPRNPLDRALCLLGRDLADADFGVDLAVAGTAARVFSATEFLDVQLLALGRSK